MHLSVETAPIFVKFLRDLVLEKDYQILINLKPCDYIALSKLPEDVAVDFFDLLTIETS
jgi:hypothetical protein